MIWEIKEEKDQIKTREIDMLEYKENIQTPLFGILEIPTISLKQPVYQKERPENEVDKNVTLLEETISQNQTHHVIILASHSGSGIHSYFKHLSYLHPNDSIYFHYQEKTIHYQLLKKEEKLKNGTLVLDNYDFPHIILITCSKTKDNIQEIYYAKKVAIS